MKALRVAMRENWRKRLFRGQHLKRADSVLPLYLSPAYSSSRYSESIASNKAGPEIM